MNDTSIGKVNQNTVESLNVFLQEMTASIHNLAIRHNGVPFSTADTHSAFSSSHENRLFNNWHYADNEMLNGLLKHSNAPLPERCRYEAQELTMPQSDCSRMTAAVSNGGCFGYSHQGMYSSQGLASNNRAMGNGIDPKQVPRAWHSEKLALEAQAYQNLVEDMKKTIQMWSTKHHSFVQASQLARKNAKAVAPHSGITSDCCLEPPWESVLQASSQIQEDGAVIRTGHSAKETPCRTPLSQLAPEGGSGDLPVVPSASCKGPQSFESASGVFSRSSRRSSLYRRRALKKVESFNSDTLEDRNFTPTLNNKSAELPSTSHCSGPIVESPDWLPHGWVTEMKTRASGTSAGCKYKCYVDPVSKRRFRSRKEVFCFLTTGNTGRYKPRSKSQQSGESYKNEGRLKHSASGLQNLLQGPNLADGSDANGTNFLERSWQYPPSGRSVFGGINIQAAALKLLTDDDDMTLEDKARLFARFSPRPGDLYGLRIPAKNFKRMKAQGKEGLEALGKVICQQGLSILRKCND
eukprot:c18245_g1_i2 orf=384-1952(+)